MALPPLGEWNSRDGLAGEGTENREPVLAPPFPKV